MSDQLDEKKLEKTDKEINQLKPSELKTRLYESTDELDSEILQKAADILFNEDISGALFLEMEMEDFKEMGLTFGCRTALVKYRKKVVGNSDFLTEELTPGKSARSSIEPNSLEPERILASGGRISRDEGELICRPEPEIYGEVTDQDWDCPELPPISQADFNPRLAANRKRGSSIFQMPETPGGVSATVLEIPSKNGLVGEPSVTGLTDDDADEKLQDTSDTVKTDDLLETADNYLELPSPQTSLDKLEKQNCEWEQKSDVGCESAIAPGCRLLNMRRPLSQSFRTKYRSNSWIPKVKPRPSETESFELPVDPKSSSKNSIRRTTLAKLRAQDKILKEGWYEKAHGHREKWKKIGWDARYGVLLETGMLIYFAELPLEKRGIMGFRRAVDMSILQKVTIEHGKDDWRIKIHSPTASPPTHLLRFACKQEMNEWRNLLLQVGGLIQPPEDGNKKHGN